MDAQITKYTLSGDGKYITVGGEADGWKFEVGYLYEEQAKATAEHQARLAALEPDDDDSIGEALDAALAGTKQSHARDRPFSAQKPQEQTLLWPPRGTRRNPGIPR